MRGFIGPALATVFGILIIVVAILALAGTIGSGAMAVQTGANQSPAAQQLAPLISFLWVVMAIGAVLAGAMYFLSKTGG